MGLSDVTDTSFDINQVLQQADAASLSAEQSGPNQVVVFTGKNDNILYQTNLDLYYRRKNKWQKILLKWMTRQTMILQRS